MGRRIRTPFVQQMERAECGAACLGMILGHFGRWVPLERLRIDCGVSRDGSRAGNLVRAAGRHGLTAKGFRVDVVEAARLPLPYVAFWASNHFVVVEGFGRGKVYLNDPAIGRRTVSAVEFERTFSGIAITMQPGEDFRREGAPPSLTAGLKRRIGESRTILTFVLLVSLTMVIPGLLVPNFAKLFVDYYLVRKFDDWLQPLLIAMAVTAILNALLTALQQHYLLRFEVRMAVASSSQLIRRLLRLPLAFFGQRSPSELAIRSTQTEVLAQLAAGSIGTAILALPAAVLFAALIMYFDLYLGLLALVLAGVNVAALAVMARSLAERNQTVLVQQTKVSAAAAAGLRMIDEYKASGTESLLFRRIVGLKSRQENLNASLQRRRLMLQAVPTAINGIATALLFTVGGVRVMSGEVSVGVLAATQALMVSFMGPVAQLVGMGSQVQNAQAYMAQIDDILLHPPEAEFASEDAARPKGVRRCVGAIELKDVEFGYSPLEPPLLSGITFAAAPGEWIAVVGPSGSGKSTIARLLAGLEAPWRGEVLIDGQPLTHIPRAVLRTSIAVVDQGVTLFEGTVRDNLVMWDPTTTEEDMVAAAKLAGIHQFIVSRPGGYEGRMAEDGANLSGGQRALIDIARAIAVNPSVLILDEATAALDAVTEADLMTNLRQLGCTTIVVAHRLSTIRDADRIIVLDQGRIVEAGNHVSLIAGNGLYRRLVEDA